MAMVLSHSSGFRSSIGAQTPLMPALATTMSRPPKVETSVSMARRIWASSLVSAVSAIASPPAAAISSRVFATSLSVRLSAATFAPSAASASAVALPMPDPAPVTNAILP
jgi:hypothetical protein